MKSPPKPYGIHWFRRDLRVQGNPALTEALEHFDGQVVGLFIFDRKFLARPDFSHNRFQFFLHTLQELKKELQSCGGDLLVLDNSPKDAWSLIFEIVKKHTGALPNWVTFNRDYEPFARKRDTKITELCHSHGVQVETFSDHLIFEPHEIRKPDGGYYQVFTPFYKNWLEKLKATGIRSSEAKETGRVRGKKFLLSWTDIVSKDFIQKDSLEKFISENKQNVTIAIPKAGAAQGLTMVKQFYEKIQVYQKDRDFPSIPGTSRLSHFFKNGSLTTKQVVQKLMLLSSASLNSGGPSTFLKEIAWREFYYHILFHRPDVEETSFNPRYADIDWENNSTLFERWSTGTTGFPIIDAGMRELLTTGHMHNRVRMIVASFLTKDLLIDWKMGERLFMKHLLDGDLAANNGGWQWAASTGCDAQPYFRVFNPSLQSEKFDPNAEYIKKFVPELSDVPAKLIHRPEENRLSQKYPRPVVDHQIQKAKAISLYKV